MRSSPSNSIDPEAGLRFALSNEKELYESEEFWLSQARAADAIGNPDASRFWNHVWSVIQNLDDARGRVAYFSEQLCLAGGNPHRIIEEMREQKAA